MIIIIVDAIGIVVISSIGIFVGSIIINGSNINGVIGSSSSTVVTWGKQIYRKLVQEKG